MKSRTRVANAALTALVVGIGMFVLPSSALAGVGLSITPTFPSPVTVGDQDEAASLVIQNNSTTPENAGTLTIFDITLTPSCGAPSGVDLDGDPFRLDNDCPVGASRIRVCSTLSATGTGVAGTACATRVFNIDPTVPARPSGQLTFTPADALPVILAAPNGTDDLDACEIAFTFDVVQRPAANRDPVPGTPSRETQQLASVDGDRELQRQSGGGTGSSTVTVLAAAILEINTVASVAPGTPSPGLQDTATIVDAAEHSFTDGHADVPALRPRRRQLRRDPGRRGRASPSARTRWR